MLTFTFNASGQLTLTLTPSSHNGYNVSCFGGRDGSIDLTVTGGSGNYNFQWSNNSQSEDIQDLQAGYYHVTVQDLNPPNENGDQEITLTQPDQLQLLDPIISSYPNGYCISLFGACNGSIQISPNGGATPYSYLWHDGSTSHNRWSLCQGQYSVTITDANGCSMQSEHYYISEPPRSDWSMSGNSGTNPSTQYLGTNDSIDFIFKTNNSERIRIKNNGKLIFKGSASFDSITLTKPLKLDTLKINRIMAQDGDSIIHFGTGSINFNQNGNNMYASPANFFVKGLGIGGDVYFPSIGFGDKSIAMGYNSGAIGIKSIAIGYHTLSSADNSVVLGSGNGSSLFSNTIQNSIMMGCNSTIPTFFISPASTSTSSGNVGIGGTTSPQARLQIDHNDQYGGMILNRISTTTSHSEIKFNQNGNEKWAIGTDIGESGKDNFFIWNHTLPEVIMTFINDGDGAVGINCDPSNISSRNHAYKLYVEGSIAAREIKVTTNTFPDYVYSENYKLMSIPNLADFIKQHHHLPGLPTAKEVSENNGIELGQMQIRILEKVEEQALYIIDLQKQIDELKACINKKK